MTYHHRRPSRAAYTFVGILAGALAASSVIAITSAHRTAAERCAFTCVQYRPEHLAPVDPFLRTSSRPRQAEMICVREGR